jgi:uncharacterized protein with PIN domain
LNRAFVDTSALVAIAFGEAGAAATARRLSSFDVVHASDLLEAELRSAFSRERVEMDRTLIDQLHLVLPRRTLSDEVARVLSAGYLRGGDCWHLATALYLAPSPHELTFVTLDERQRAVAATLGFAT